MNPTYRLADNAARDLREIWKYITQDNPNAANRLVKRFQYSFDLLAKMPRLGGVREQYAPGLRSFPVGNYVVYYRVLHGDPAIEILRILHGRRDSDSIFGSHSDDGA